jgi:CRISPR-associated protein Csb2
LGPAPGRGEQRDRFLAAAAAERGAAVVQVRPERTSQVDRYVHKVNEHAVIRPYSAVLSLGEMGGDRVVQAIGQSRHLGGGLLVPRDVARVPDHRGDGGEHGAA